MHPVAVLQRETEALTVWQPEEARNHSVLDDEHVLASQRGHAAPCSASSPIGALKAVENFVGGSKGQGAALLIIKRCRGRGDEGNVDAKPEWVTLRGIGLKMCRNPGFFTCPIQTVHHGAVLSAGEPECD